MNVKNLTALAVLAMGGMTTPAFELAKEDQAELRHASQGAILNFPELARERGQLPVIPLTFTTRPGPLLLFSDMPEYLGASNGIALQENITPGNYRLYVYHVPGTKTVPKTVSVIVQNLGGAPLHLQFDHCGFPAPGADYGVMGVTGIVEFFTGKTLPPPLSIASRERQILDSRLEQIAASDPQLVHAFYGFHLDQPARLTVLQRDPGQASTNIIDSLPGFPRQFPGKNSSGAGRGIFPDADVTVANANNSVIDSANGVQRLLLADGRQNRWIQGTDGLTSNMAVTNKGSYGVFYRARLAYSSSDGRLMAILVGRANGERRPMAALSVSDGIFPGGWQAITASHSTTHERGAVAVAQKFAAPARGTTNYVDIIYSPPGGSSLPTPIYFVPFDQ